MARVTPTIRAAVAGLVFLWMEQNNLSLDGFLTEKTQPLLTASDPLQAIPLQSFTALLCDLCREEGPDVPTRIVQGMGDVSKTMMGPVSYAATTCGEALTLASNALPLFSSHEHFVVDHRKTGVVIRQFWGVTLDAETLHYVHQFVAAMLEMFFHTVRTRNYPLSSIELTPHPDLGLDFLRDQYRCELLDGRQVLAARVDARALEATFQHDTNAAPPSLPAMETLRGTGGLAGSAKVVLRAMLEFGQPSVQRLAEMMGVSSRTFQRLLKQEQTSYSQLLAEARQEAAAEWFDLNDQALKELAATLGYAHQSSLTRAIKRWQGEPPSRLAKKRI